MQGVLFEVVYCSHYGSGWWTLFLHLSELDTTESYRNTKVEDDDTVSRERALS